MTAGPHFVLRPWELSDLPQPWITGSVRTAEAAGFRREGLLRSWQRVGERRRDMLMYASVNEERPSGGRAATDR
ncbi:hypothetical protein F0344_26975 [Streptomyces finlayi]|uniref:GNAT family N-acetyltransferase n=1 Tax=Streptomyces finlayi TaxID=67296 RepID=A0A7G7BQY8_9ACTN|nr:hypothetical protein [Streptomyces finlayi]QNE77753.1 hypothetical protein F0344_26975 [Streptomyces finlayi]